MSPRRSTQSTREDGLPSDPATSAAIGRIEARLDGQEATDNRIESTLTQLMHDHNEERKNSAVQFGEIGKQVAKIGIILEESVKANKTMIKNQEGMIETMNEMASNNKQLEAKYNEFHKTVEEHLISSDKWIHEVEERLRKLEMTKYLWYTIGALLLTILCALSYIATVVDVFGKK